MNCLNNLKWALAFTGFVFVTVSTYSSAAERASRFSAGPFESKKAKISYAIGARYGEGLKRQVGDIELEMFLKGLKDAHLGDTLLLEENEIVQLITGFKQKRITEVNAEKAALAAKNKVEGKHFLLENKTRDGVLTVESGLQYKILKEGTGLKPKSTDTVRVHYHGTLINGVVFDSSLNRGESITFKVNGVIKGWTEALQLMKVGAKWQLFIPADLAYGMGGTPGAIGPNAALIFDVELIAIES